MDFLKNNLAGYEVVVRSSPNAIAVVKEGKFVFVNPAAARILGYETCEELIDIEMFSVIAPDSLQEIRERLGRLEDGKGNELTEVKLVRKDGSTVWIESRSVPITIDGESAVLLYGQDIDERISYKQAFQDRLRFETFLSEASASFVNLSTESVEEEIKRWLGKFAGVLKVEKTFFLELSKDGATLEVVSHYTAPGHPVYGFRDLRGKFEWATKQLKQGKIVSMNSPEDCPSEAVVERETFTRDSIRFLLIVPIRVAGLVLSAFGFLSYSQGFALEKELISSIKLIGEIFTNALLRQRSEMALRESEERYRSIFDSEADAMLVFDLDGKIVDANYKACEIYNYSIDELIGLHGRNIVGRNHYFLFESFLETYEGQWFTCESVDVKKNGETFFTEIHGTRFNIRNEPRLFAIIRDINLRKKAEAALRESEANLRSIFRAAPMGIGFIRNQRLERVNERFCKMFGYKIEEVIGRHTSVLFATEGSWQEALELFNSLSKSQIRTVETVLMHRSGNKIEVLLSAALVDPEDPSVGASFAVLDITERKRADRDREALTHHFQQSQKMEAIGTLAGGIAHDFNNILTSVLGYADLIIDDIPDNLEALANLQEIIRAGNRAKDLIGQILTFSRQTKEQRSPIKLQMIVKEATKLLRSSLPTTLGIEVKIDPNCRPVIADSTQIHQVLMNLCTNAFHAMREQAEHPLEHPQGGVLEVGLSPCAIRSDGPTEFLGVKPGQYVQLTVRDTGVGMTPAVRARIFEPYFTTKEKGEGTGLGLAVVHAIIQSHGGAIGVESELGKGTTFKVLFPICEISRDARTGRDSRPPDIKGSEHILLVDDEPSITDAGKKMLERLGYTVTICDGAQEALGCFQKDPDAFDIVVTDLTMPKMTGLELGQNLLEIRPDIPIILCTGFSETVSAAHAKASGFADFVYKPVIAKDLSDRIRRIIDGSAGGSK